MPFSITSEFFLSGDATQTLNTLTKANPVGSNDLTKVSSTSPTKENQVIFMNQPLSWWVASLNSGVIKYTPIGNDVNWSYIPSSGAGPVHISMTVSNLIIPNKTKKVDRNSGSMAAIVEFEPKFGLSRIDTHNM